MLYLWAIEAGCLKLDNQIVGGGGRGFGAIPRARGFYLPLVKTDKNIFFIKEYERRSKIQYI